MSIRTLWHRRRAAGGSAPAGGGSAAAGGTLRAVLEAVRNAPVGTRLDGLAARLGLARDELDAMIDYWVQRGELVVDEIGCPTSGCGGCPMSAACGARERPVLLAIRSR